MFIDIQHIKMMCYQSKKLFKKYFRRGVWSMLEKTLPNIVEQLGAWIFTNKRLLN